MPQALHPLERRQLRDLRSAAAPMPTAPALTASDGRGERGILLWLQIALLVIALNSVLIQTIATDDQTLKNVVRVVVLLITVFVAFTHRAIFPISLMLILLFSICLLLMTQNPDQLTLIYILLMMPAMWSVNERNLTRAVMIASLFALGLIFLFLLLGLTSNELRVSQTWVSADVRYRYTFGTAGVPFFMNVVYGAATMLIFYMFRWQLRWRRVVAMVVLAGSLWIFTQTDGRGGFLSILIFCVLAILMPSLSKWSVTRGLLLLQPLVYLGAALWLASRSEDPQINQLFSFRPMLYGQFFEGVTFWDLMVSTTVKQGETSTVDSSYLHLLYGAGIVLFVIFCIAFARAVLVMSRRGMMLELAFLTSVMVYASLESILLRAENVFILLAWYFIIRYGLGITRTPKGGLQT